MNYTEEHKKFLRKNYPKMTQPVLTKAFNEKFNEALNVKTLSSSMKRFGIKSGRDGCFEPGSQPWNTGTKGVMKPNSGNFKKGHVPSNLKPLGHERVCNRSRDGILIKIAEDNPYTGAKTRYKSKQVYVWEQNFGPVPDGHVVFVRDSNIENCEPDNLVLITRAELVRLNKMGYRKMSAEIKPSILALVQMKCKMWDLMKKDKH